MVEYLEALERLAMPDDLHIKECKKLGIGLTEDYDVVEQALLELQYIKKANLSEALDRLKNIALSDLDSIPATAIPICEKYNNEVIEDYETIQQALLKAEKEHKVLEIIKEKKVDVFRFKKLDFNTFNQLQKSCKLPELTEEQFKLLKEVLE